MIFLYFPVIFPFTFYTSQSRWIPKVKWITNGKYQNILMPLLLDIWEWIYCKLYEIYAQGKGSWKAGHVCFQTLIHFLFFSNSPWYTDQNEIEFAISVVWDGRHPLSAIHCFGKSEKGEIYVFCSTCECNFSTVSFCLQLLISWLVNYWRHQIVANRSAKWYQIKYSEKPVQTILWITRNPV